MNYSLLDSFYGVKLECDIKAYTKMLKKVEQMKKDMGDLYLLSKPISKKDLTKGKKNG